MSESAPASPSPRRAAADLLGRWALFWLVSVAFPWAVEAFNDGPARRLGLYDADGTRSGCMMIAALLLVSVLLGARLAETRAGSVAWAALLCAEGFALIAAVYTGTTSAIPFAVILPAGETIATVVAVARGQTLTRVNRAVRLMAGGALALVVLAILAVGALLLSGARLVPT